VTDGQTAIGYNYRALQHWLAKLQRSVNVNAITTIGNPLELTVKNHGTSLSAQQNGR